MPLALHIDRQAEQPLYRQIAGQIRALVRDGRLPVGARLPATRSLAGQLGVTRLTVQTAYDELRAQGWVDTAVGRGTFVVRAAPPEALMETVGHSVTTTGVLDDLPRYEQIDIVRSFATAEPDAELFPVGMFWGYLNQLRPEGVDLMRYTWPQGDVRLRTALADLLRERGIEVMPDGILVTAGVTQGISLLLHALTRPGDVVALNSPAHIGLLEGLRACQIQPVGVPLDGEGPRLDVLEKVIVQYRPRFFFTVPCFHDPTGLQMSGRRRLDLLGLARGAGLMLVEDDSRAPLAYDGEPTPALKAEDERDQVVTLGGFSKSLMPGLRIGYVVAPHPLLDQLVTLRRAADFCGMPFVQRALANYILDGEFRQHLRRVLPVYRERRDSLLRALARHMPPGVEWTSPAGGFACWLTLPPGVSAVDVHRDALRRGFAFTPGDAFLIEPDLRDHLRICFASHPPDVIEEASAVLGWVIRRQAETAAHWQNRPGKGLPPAEPA